MTSAAQKTPVLNAVPLQVVSSAKTDSMKTDSMNADDLSVKVNPSYISTIPTTTNVTLINNSDEKSQTLSPAPINKTYVMPTFKTADEVQKYLLENNISIELNAQEQK